MSFLKRLHQNAERWLLLIFYALIITTVAQEVIRRFILNYSSNWAEEVARYSFIYLAWIGAAVAVRDRSHIRIDAIIEFIPEKAQQALLLMGDILTLVIAVMVFYTSFDPLINAVKYASVTDGLRISRAWFLFAIPLGFGVLIMRTLEAIYQDVMSLFFNKDLIKSSGLF